MEIRVQRRSEARKQHESHPFEAVIVNVDAGRIEETHLSAVFPRHARVDALPDGGFVIADTGGEVRIFDALGRPSWWVLDIAG
ncbi:hypothetical protein AMK26_34125 [Streptomyces sp. CB03234]|uniref:hypothetical protein n=1 Tax=Streptomyces sp. (strain CB03234) TaxID=1703937 RepID=UPI00093BC334|nr:hypothetical protein [Streptomyces sp. CB03234]OKJ93526.1 hypothetical protein AMK26_34125 [Streptomyces sp. CB03234]